MESFLTFLQKTGPYMVIPILLVCLYQWRNLPLPFRIYAVGVALVATLSVLRAVFGPSNGWFFVSAFFGVTLYGYLFHVVLTKRIDRRIVWVCVVVIWAIIGWYVLQQGVQKFQLWIIIPYDLFMITFCMIYVVSSLRNPQQLNPAVLYLMLYLLMEFFVNLFLDMMSNFLKFYFSDNFMSLLWKKMLPVYNLLRLSLILWIVLSIKPKRPSLDKMPRFDPEP